MPRALQSGLTGAVARARAQSRPMPTIHTSRAFEWPTPITLAWVAVWLLALATACAVAWRLGEQAGAGAAAAQAARACPGNPAAPRLRFDPAACSRIAPGYALECEPQLHAAR